VVQIWGQATLVFVKTQDEWKLIQINVFQSADLPMATIT
jgi:ketosteroid isomerase-like protein